MSLNSYIVLLTIYIACKPLTLCGNVANENSSDVVNNTQCGFRINISCDFGKICRDGVCIDVETNSTDGGEVDSSSTEMTSKVVSDPTYTRPPRRTQPRIPFTYKLMFWVSSVLSIIFFVLICFCSKRMKQRRLEQQREQRQQAATHVGPHGSQASRTEDWNAEFLSLGNANVPLIGDLDAFVGDFMFPRVRLPPYDFSSAYHKPTRITMTEEKTGEEESSGDVIVDVQNTSEDPPPYSNQQFNQLDSPPNYNETLTVSTTAGEKLENDRYHNPK